MQWKVRIFFGKIKITFMFTSFSFSKTCPEKWYHPSDPLQFLAPFPLVIVTVCPSFFQKKISSNLCNWPKHAISINCQTFSRAREKKKKYFCGYSRALEKCYCDCFGTLLKLIREVYTDKASTLKHFLPKSD